MINKSFLCGLVLFSFLLIGCASEISEVVTASEEGPKPKIEFPELEIYGDKLNSILIAFTVTVPENTLENDEVYLGIEDYFVEIDDEFTDIPMMQMENNKWGVFYRAPANKEIRYNYNRNNDRDTREVRGDFRAVSVNNGNLEINDAVENWRWNQGDLSKDLEMIFVVNVPENTPEEDIVYIHPYGKEELRMDKIDKYKHKVTLNSKDLDFVANEKGGNILWYRYSRNKWDYITAEFLEPDTNDYYWTKRGRETFFEPGRVQEDTVKRWRWFPEGPLVKEDVSHLEVPSSFPDRVNKMRFRSGQGIQDLYIKGFDDFFNNTAQHMQDIGYEWAVFYPAWQWKQDEPLPKMNNDHVINPNYPDDILVKQIKEYKNKGIKVILAPQVCCTEINSENRDEKWWQEYFNEIKRFMMHHAKLAEISGADALIDDFSRTGISEVYGDEIVKIEQDSWQSIWGDVREEYSGELGQMVWNFGPEFGGLSPSADFITWADKLDFFYVQSEAELSEKSNPTDDELLEGAEKELITIQQLYDKHGKPVILQSGFHSIKESWHGFKEIDLDNPRCGESESSIGCDKIYSQTDQARAIHAYFTALREKPWVIGYLNFGYEQYILPMLPGWSIRGKAAEDIWESWNGILYE